MRKTCMYGLGLAVGIFAAACSDENDPNQGINGEGIVFTSSVGSRATDTSFEAGDQIGISMIADGSTVASNVQYQTADGTGFSSASPVTYGMSGASQSVDFSGVYPYVASSVADNVYSFSLSAEEGAPLTRNDVMYAFTSDIAVGTKNVPLTFTHKLVKVVMQLKDAAGNPVSDAALTINNQQLAGTLNLSDGTVAATDAPTSTLPFAANASVSGEYQTIVMPSEAVQGRCISITRGEMTYSSPVDMYEFETGKKLTFTATLNEDGTLEAGDPVSIVPNITDWTAERVEQGWILSGEVNVLGKTARQLAANVSLSGTGVNIGDFQGSLNADDVYSLSYSRGNEESASALPEAKIIIAPRGGGIGKGYTLPAGQASGRLLVPVGENVSGIFVSAEGEGITLTDVTVYTTADILLPVLLWEGNATANAQWPNDITNFTISEENRSALAPGAVLRIYGNISNPDDFEIKFNFYKDNSYQTDGPGICDRYNYENHDDYISVPLWAAVIEAIEKNDYVVGLVGKNCSVTRIELLPASAGSTAGSDLLWKGSSMAMYSEWSFINFWLPSDVAVGSTIRISFNQLGTEGKISGAVLTWNNAAGKNDQDVILPLTNFASDATYVDYTLDEPLLQTLQEKGLIGGNTPIAVMGGTGPDGDGAYCGVVVTQVELLNPSGE